MHPGCPDEDPFLFKMGKPRSSPMNASCAGLAFWSAPNPAKSFATIYAAKELVFAREGSHASLAPSFLAAFPGTSVQDDEGSFAPAWLCRCRRDGGGRDDREERIRCSLRRKCTTSSFRLAAIRINLLIENIIRTRRNTSRRSFRRCSPMPKTSNARSLRQSHLLGALHQQEKRNRDVSGLCRLRFDFP
jgi:hypothetical protein